MFDPLLMVAAVALQGTAIGLGRLKVETVAAGMLHRLPTPLPGFF